MTSDMAGGKVTLRVRSHPTAVQMLGNNPGEVKQSTESLLGCLSPPVRGEQASREEYSLKQAHVYLAPAMGEYRPFSYPTCRHCIPKPQLAVHLQDNDFGSAPSGTLSHDSDICPLHPFPPGTRENPLTIPHS